MKDEIILLNKPAGITSFSAVRKAGRVIGEKKGGHTGTLDPNASGLMILLFGKYTKYVPFTIGDHKRYHAEFTLGLKSDTEDIWGEIHQGKRPDLHSQRQLDMIAESFLGEQQQTPPMYSAIRHNGKHLYELAREGIEVVRKSRTITVYDLKVSHLYDQVYDMDACVSAGTYIRTLITDYADAMHEDAVMSSLVRTGIGNLRLEDAASFEEIAEGKGRVTPSAIIDPSWKLVDYDREDDLINGRRVSVDCPHDHVIFTFQGEIMAAYEKRDDGFYHCVRGLR